MWLYHCFSLSLREVELILAQRGIVVSYESIRAWSLRFGRAQATSAKARRQVVPGRGVHPHPRQAALPHYLWRAVDQHGRVLDIQVQSRRNAKAAKRFFGKLLKGLQYVPRVVVTDKLKSRHRLTANDHRAARDRAFQIWRDVAGVTRTA